MTRVLILGAAGQIAQWVVRLLVGRDDVQMTLYVRDAGKLLQVPANARVVQGDVMDHDTLLAALHGQDLVYANLAGEVDAQAARIVEAMSAAGVRRLVFINSLGIYDEVPGPFGAWNRHEIGAYLPPYRRAADVIEASALDYTLVRAAWLQDADEVDFELTARDEAFKGTEVSRKSVAALVTELVLQPERLVRANVGVNKPGTEGDKPAFA